jgi:outer membrane protein assembly factor BamD (BamD/ComL family)
MKRTIRTIIGCAALAAALALLASCASQNQNTTDGLTAGEIFQRAQDAVDRGDYAGGISFYTLCQQRYPDDLNHQVWASYEIAFIYHKMGNNVKALALFNDLLARYAKEGDTLPPAPQVLAQKLKTRLEEATKTKS